jgi:hypothetical protein
MKFNCPKCGKGIKVSDEKAGKKGKCPGCGEVLTIPTAEEIAQDSQKPDDRKPALDFNQIRQQLVPVVASLDRVSELSAKAQTVSEDLRLIESTLKEIRSQMESHLSSVISLLDSSGELVQGSPAQPKEAGIRMGPLTDEEMKKVAIQIANPKTGEYRCLSCRTVWQPQSRLLGSNPTDPWKCPNGCNSSVVL